MQHPQLSLHTYVKYLCLKHPTDMARDCKLRLEIATGAVAVEIYWPGEEASSQAQAQGGRCLAGGE